MSAYRYTLSRRWLGEQPPALFIMLNPSTADESADDPTIRKCCGFAQRWGCSGIDVVNLFAIRSTNPHHLLSFDDPIGPENDAHIRSALTAQVAASGLVVAAWGANGGAWPGRVNDVCVNAWEAGAQLRNIGPALKGGHPRHPLMAPYSDPLLRWPVAALGGVW